MCIRDRVQARHVSDPLVDAKIVQESNKSRFGFARYPCQRQICGRTNPTGRSDRSSGDGIEQAGLPDTRPADKRKHYRLAKVANSFPGLSGNERVWLEAVVSTDEPRLGNRQVEHVERLAEITRHRRSLLLLSPWPLHGAGRDPNPV